MILSGATQGHFWTILGPKWDDFGVILDHFRIIRVSFWGHLENILVSLGPHFEPFLDHFDPFGAIFRSFCGRFCGFLLLSWEVHWKIKQNETTEGKNMEISATIHLAKASLFSPIKLVLLKKNDQNRRFNL